MCRHSELSKSCFDLQISAAAGRLPVRISPPKPVPNQDAYEPEHVRTTPPEPSKKAAKRKTPPRFPSHLKLKEAKPLYAEETDFAEEAYEKEAPPQVIHELNCLLAWLYAFSAALPIAAALSVLKPVILMQTICIHPIACYSHGPSRQ